MGPRVVVEAVGPGEPPALPGTVVRESPSPGVLRLTVPARESDAVLHALLTARPPWHIRAVRPESEAGAAGAEGAFATESVEDETEGR